jgi:hypothetical protein
VSNPAPNRPALPAKLNSNSTQRKFKQSSTTVQTVFKESQTDFKQGSNLFKGRSNVRQKFPLKIPSLDFAYRAVFPNRKSVPERWTNPVFFSSATPTEQASISHHDSRLIVAIRAPNQSSNPRARKLSKAIRHRKKNRGPRLPKRPISRLSNLFSTTREQFWPNESSSRKVIPHWDEHPNTPFT